MRDLAVTKVPLKRLYFWLLPLLLKLPRPDTIRYAVTVLEERGRLGALAAIESMSLKSSAEKPLVIFVSFGRLKAVQRATFCVP